MDGYEAIVTKRDTRSFSEEPVARTSWTGVRELLGIPDDHEAPMGVGIGHPGPSDDKQESSPRIPLDELVNRGRWRPEPRAARLVISRPHATPN